MSNVERSTDFVKDLGSAVRENPVASALVGMGVAWMLFGGRSFPKVGSVLEQIPGAARDSIGAAADGLKSTFDRASSGMSDIGEAVGSAASSAYAQAADVASVNARPMGKLGLEVVDNTRAALAETFESQPLMLGVIGLAIGAGIAAALPATDIETAYLSETSGRVQEMAKEFAGEQFGNVVDRVQDVATAVASEAEKQGLNRDGLGALVGDFSKKVAKVAGSATAGVGGV